MFEKIITNEYCMRVLGWLLQHPISEYRATIVSIECNIQDLTQFIAVITILEGCKIVKVNQQEEELMIQLDEEENSVKLLQNLKEEINNNAYLSPQVSPALAYFSSEEVKNTVDNLALEELIRDLDDFDNEELYNMCKNYKELDTSNELNSLIYNLCSDLEKSGEYEVFMNKFSFDEEEE